MLRGVWRPLDQAMRMHRPAAALCWRVSVRGYHTNHMDIRLAVLPTSATGQEFSRHIIIATVEYYNQLKYYTIPVASELRAQSRMWTRDLWRHSGILPHQGQKPPYPSSNSLFPTVVQGETGGLASRNYRTATQQQQGSALSFTATLMLGWVGLEGED
jgi:hypothetical protein